MEIAFRTRSLQKVLGSEELLKRDFGEENGRLIMRRLMVLAAATSLANVPRDPPERCHQLKGKKKGHFAVDVKHPFRLVFKPAHDPLPLLADGGLDLTCITSVCILSIEDYHR